MNIRGSQATEASISSIFYWLFFHCISVRSIAGLRGLRKQKMTMCNTKKCFPAERHHHCCGGDVLESTLDSGRDSCGACCRSGAVQEDDEGYLRHVAFGVLNRPAIRSDAVVLATALLQCLQCLLEFCVIPIWRVCPAPPGCYGRKLTPLFHEFGAAVSGNPVLSLGSVMFTDAGSTCAGRGWTTCDRQVDACACVCVFCRYRVAGISGYTLRHRRQLLVVHYPTVGDCVRLASR